LNRVLYVIVCATPAAQDVGKLVRYARAKIWDTCVIATPSALKFFDQPSIETLTGHPVRTDYKHPSEPDILPPPDALIAAPASFNTINKWASGIADTLALGLLTEAIGKRLPIVAVPFVNAAQAHHPAFPRSIEVLKRAGVQVLGPDGHEPGTGFSRIESFPWILAFDALEERIV
jgi:phosphopantothenoylcysteine synthetase/decarboxylase